MLRAVIIGWAQPRRSHLLRRRWMRRLLFRSFRRMMVFTRNPFVHPVLEKADTPINTGKTEGFRVFHEFLPANARNFACLGTSTTIWCATTAKTDSNSNVETDLMATPSSKGSRTINANTFSVGDVLILRAGGYYSTKMNNQGFLTMTVYFGIELGAMDINPIPGGQNKTPWYYEAMIVRRADVGMVPTMCVLSRFKYSSMIAEFIGEAGNINPTFSQNNDVKLTATWSVADAANTITLDSLGS